MVAQLTNVNNKDLHNDFAVDLISLPTKPEVPHQLCRSQLVCLTVASDSHPTLAASSVIIATVAPHILLITIVPLPTHKHTENCRDKVAAF